MILTQRSINSDLEWKGSILNSLEFNIENQIDERPIRFAITKTDHKGHECELGVIKNQGAFSDPNVIQHIVPSIFKFVPRRLERTDKFTAVLVVPTGIGAEIGGHSGDAGAVARLIAASCDKLITHPNVVNAADINELPENGLYVEGSVITSLLMGTTGLQEVRSNRIMVVMDKNEDRQISNLTINTVSAARAAVGIDCPFVAEIDRPFVMEGEYSSSGCAVGRIEGLENICDIMDKHRKKYDSVAFHTRINVPDEYHLKYLQSKGEMVNPWGGVEAMLTHSLTAMYGVPTAHAPMVDNMNIANLDCGLVDPRMASEAVSSTFLMCVLKGLHRSPRIIKDSELLMSPGVLTSADISCLIIPDGCVGLPTLAAMEQGIPVIAVRENKNRMQNNLADYPFHPGKLFIVENYLEAVGVMNALKGGVSIESIRRPLAYTEF